MNAWERMESGEIYAVKGIVLERIKYSVLVTVEAVECFWYGVMLGSEMMWEICRRVCSSCAARSSRGNNGRSRGSISK